MAGNSFWMKDAVKRPGAFKAKAKKAGMSTAEYASKVTKKGSKADARTKKQATSPRPSQSTERSNPMPLLRGKKNIGRNIKTEEAAGKPRKQAIAIALREAGVPRECKHYREQYLNGVKTCLSCLRQVVYDPEIAERVGNYRPEPLRRGANRPDTGRSLDVLDLKTQLKSAKDPEVRARIKTNIVKIQNESSKVRAMRAELIKAVRSNNHAAMEDINQWKETHREYQ